MSSYIMRREDEFTHQPDPVPNFNESVYTNAFDFRRRVGGWMRLGNRVNEGRAELSVCLYLPDGRIACQFLRPKISHNDAFDAGGLRYRVIEPLRQVEMTYEGELLLVENPEDLREPQKLFAEGERVEGRASWTFTASSPVHGGEPAEPDTPTLYGRDFSRGHFNQHGVTKGEIRVGGEVHPIEGRGWRDHSWGPRYWTVIYYYRLFIANFPNGDAFMLLRITDEAGHTRRQGVLLVNGHYEEVTDMDIITDWTAAQDPARVRIAVATQNRKTVIEGTVLTLAPLRNRRQDEGRELISRIAEGYTEFRWNGQTGYGMTEYIERLEDGRPVGYPL